MKQLTEEQKKDIESRVRDVVSEMSGWRGSPTLSQRLQSDLDMDSLDLADLAMELEEEFSIAIPEERLSRKTPDKTVGQLVALVWEIVAEKEGAEA